MKRLQIARAIARSNTSTAGFTLLEVLAVLIMAAVLAAIAAPSWARYVANRRVQAVQAEVRQSLEQSQTLARTSRDVQGVVFELDEPNPTVTIPTSSGGTTTRRLGSREVPDGQVTLDVADVNGLALDGVSFDFQGTYANAHQGASTDPNGIDDGNIAPNADLPIIITVSADQAASRCVVVRTLLGSLRSGSGADCDPATYNGNAPGNNAPAPAPAPAPGAGGEED